MDEPYLHYTYRQLKTITEKFTVYLQDSNIEESVAEFEEQTEHLDKLLNAQKHAMVSTPHSVHHIFTNLEKPPQGLQERFRRITEANYCLEEFANIPHTLGPDLEKKYPAGSRVELCLRTFVV